MFHFLRYLWIYILEEGVNLLITLLFETIISVLSLLILYNPYNITPTSFDGFRTRLNLTLFNFVIILARLRHRDRSAPTKQPIHPSI